MTTFRVGQLIKKVRGETNVGDVATVFAVNVPGRGNLTMRVKHDKPWVNCDGEVMPAGHLAYTDPDNWEPLSDSNTLVSWESMRDLWVPEHLREAA